MTYDALLTLLYLAACLTVLVTLLILLLGRPWWRLLNALGLSSYRPPENDS